MKLFFWYKMLIFITIFSFTVLYGGNPNEKWLTKLDEQRKLRVVNTDTSIKIGNLIIQQCDNDSIKAQSYSLLGVSYFLKNDLANGFKYIYQAKEMMSEKKYPLKLIIRNNVMLIDIYARLELYDNAQSEVENTIGLIEKHNSKDYFEIAMLYASYGGLLNNTKKYKKSLSKYKLSLENLDKIKDPKLLESKNFLTALSLSEIGNLYIWINDFKNAEHYILLSKGTSGEFSAPYIKLLNTVRLGIIFFKTDRYTECIEILQPLSNNREIDYVFQNDIHRFLAGAYKNTGDEANYKIEQSKVDSINRVFSEQKNATFTNVVSQVETQLTEKKRESIFYQVMVISLSVLTISIIVMGIFLYRNEIKKDKARYDSLIADIEQKIASQKKPIKEKIKIRDSTLSKTELVLMEKLDQFEQQKGFLKKDLSIAVLAVDLDTNASYLSEIINKTKNQNFNSYINELRINYIIQELCNNPRLLQYKISHLADITGFNSHNTFTIVFKKITNTSPSFFIEQRRKENQTES